MQVRWRGVRESAGLLLTAAADKSVGRGQGEVVGHDAALVVGGSDRV